MVRSLMGAFLGLAGLLATAAAAQDEFILVDVKVNYGVAFRGDSWVPIDVYVKNTERDVSGFVEIRTFGFSGDLQSPTYRVPAESPKNSQKRFRVYGKLRGADRIEAQLYHGGRSALPGPTRLKVTSIDQQDYLGLVLDDTHHDYGFLSEPMVIGNSERRFHREGLTSDELGNLADHFLCYTPFDIIVLGNIDPERIAPNHRELLRQYVTLGGTLAINLGTNADRYKGTWVESLMGVTIGANAFESEPTLAATALSLSANSPGLTANREGMVTRIEAASDDLRSLGQDFRLGAVHPMGSGRVATFTVDAVSGLMQHQPDFLAYWNQLLLQSILERPLNMSAIVEAASSNLPRIAGVRLFPVSSVIAYLLLYFFIAIVGNWLFWNKMKRREMAWVCLVIFSLLFTSYAMIFGTQGRARTTQLEQLEIMEFASAHDTVLVHAVTGLLAKGSGRFDATLPHSGTLLSDAASDMAIGTHQSAGLFGPQSQEPFHFVQSQPGEVEGLTVGASEMRFIQTETPIALDGAIESTLTMSEEGLRGTIVNNTGYEFANATLLHDGLAIRLDQSEDTYTVPLEIREGDSRRAGTNAAVYLDASETAHLPPDADPAMRSDFNGFLTQFPTLALAPQQRAVPPCLIAWVKNPPMDMVDMGDRASLQLGAALAIVWLDVRDERIENGNPIALAVRIKGDPEQLVFYGYGNQYNPNSGNYYPDSPPVDTFVQREFNTKSNWDSTARPMYPDEEFELSVSVPAWFRGRPGYGVELTVVVDPKRYAEQHIPGQCDASPQGNRGFQLVLLDEVTNKDVALPATETRSSTITLSPSNELAVTTLVFDNWNEMLAPRSTTLSFRAVPRDLQGKSLADTANTRYRGREGRQGPHYHVHVSARLVKRNTETLGD